jgi:hypothetical protein
MARLKNGRGFPQPSARVLTLISSAFAPAVLLRDISMRLGPVLPVSVVALSLVVACALTLPVSAQTDVNDVHIAPREVEKAKVVAPPELTSSKADLDAGKLSARVRPLKVDVDLVLVPVTITDPLNRLVTGLEKENFQLFDGNAPQ